MLVRAGEWLKLSKGKRLMMLYNEMIRQHEKRKTRRA